jgi:hypothetical protein
MIKVTHTGNIRRDFFLSLDNIDRRLIKSLSHQARDALNIVNI